MIQRYRLTAGGMIDRGRPLRFQFNGRPFEGHCGDTLASALLANGVKIVARSFKYHRPRGIFSAGPEEPSALVQLEEGAFTEPNRRPTEIALYEGLRARSQHAWPSLGGDLGAVVGGLAPLFPAGFYYKMFHRSQAMWQRLWEPALRRMAGLGRAPSTADPSRYDKRHAHCDVLVVGGGPAGLSAALAAGRTGARVVLAEHDPEFGGGLLRRPEAIGGIPAATWVADAVAELRSIPGVLLLPATAVSGRYDGNYFVAVERVGELLGPGAPAGLPRQRLWHIRAGRAVLATGAIERLPVFAGNDRPGIMLSSAVETYLNRYAVLPGRRAVLYAENDDGYHAAAALVRAGARVVAIADPRAQPGGQARRLVPGVTLYSGHTVAGTAGRRGLRLVSLRPRNGTRLVPIRCDLLAVSGGWTPTLHLYAQAGGRLRFEERLAAFLPDGDDPTALCAGAANGSFGLGRSLAEGEAAGLRAALGCGFGDGRNPPAPLLPEPYSSSSLPAMPPPREAAHAFVDLHNDVTAADIALAVREGYGAVEHLKRYTTLGMGTDQGKTGNLAGLALLAALSGRAIGDTGTTTFRPPYLPVSYGALAGRERGRLADPVRLTPMHDWHLAAGAVFEDVGQWRRPRYYPRAGEDMAAAVARECLAARDRVALLDASTLGKIAVAGPDAAIFLDRIYTGSMAALALGRCRYGLMCHDDGMVFDDGVVSRLAPDLFHLTTTTGNAAAVLDWLEEWLQTEWPGFQVFCTPVTEEWANATLVGPQAGTVLSALGLEPALIPFMCLRETMIGGIGARLFRVSFSGELSYEINVPADRGPQLWELLIAAGEGFGITPYGTEAMHVMRAEKGYIIIGQETDGSVTPVDLGMGALLAPDKDFLGRRALSRRDLVRPDRKQLVGLLPEDPKTVLPEGAQLVAAPGGRPPLEILGHVTSSYFGARLGRSFALALVAGGRARHGETLYAPLPDRTIAARVCPPVFYDLENRRARA